MADYKVCFRLVDSSGNPVTTGAAKLDPFDGSAMLDCAHIGNGYWKRDTVAEEVPEGKYGIDYAAADTGFTITVGHVITTDIVDANITTAKIADLNVTTGKINTDAVTTVKILDANVTTDKIANLNVTTAKINTSAVETAKIADNAVDKDKINSDIAGVGLTQAGSGALDVTDLSLDELDHTLQTEADADEYSGGELAGDGYIGTHTNVLSGYSSPYVELTANTIIGSANAKISGNNVIITWESYVQGAVKYTLLIIEG